MNAEFKAVYMLLSSAMVLATLAGRKTMTRRGLKEQPTYYPQGMLWKTIMTSSKAFADQARALCPYGQPGGRIKVKEAAWMWCKKQQDGYTATGRPKWRYIPVGQHVLYSAEHPARPTNLIDDNPEHGWRLKIGRFLPGWAIRIHLEVTEIRVERVQDISAADAVAEGVFELEVEGPRWHWDEKAEAGYPAPWSAFRALWTKINGDPTWNSNDWVWVVSFKRIPCG